MKELPSDKVKLLVDTIGPSLGYDLTYEPVFPPERKDICAVRRLAENGSSYGYDTIYLVWNNDADKLYYREIANSKISKDYIHINKVSIQDGQIVVEIGSGGSYSGKPWTRTISTNFTELGLK